MARSKKMFLRISQSVKDNSGKNIYIHLMSMKWVQYPVNSSGGLVTTKLEKYLYANYREQLQASRVYCVFTTKTGGKFFDWIGTDNDGSKKYQLSIWYKE